MPHHQNNANRVLGRLFLLCAVAFPAAAEPAPSVTSAPFGKMPDGTPVEVYTLTSGRGLEASVLTLGATLHTVRFPDRSGKSDVLTIHYDTVDARLKDGWATGGTIGRFANRIGGASFKIDGVDYKLEANAGKNHIHGGSASGFLRQVWKAEPVQADQSAGVKLTLLSPDGQGGYPGTVTATVVYTVNADNELVMDYTATTDKPTHVNLTNHAYWNLGGVKHGDVKSQVLQLEADRYLLADADLIPTGTGPPVKDTPLDFTTARPIGSKSDEMPKKHYDQCFILSKSRKGPRLTQAARASDPLSGRVMEVWTTQPAVIFFTGHPKGFCLETQHYPDSPHQPAFPSTLLRPGQTLHEQTVHKFSVVP